MSRPDIKGRRRAQILDAFETCVARFGVEGATLARTASEAGLARALIRHNVGNRDDLMAALVERYLARSRESLEALIIGLPSDTRLRSMIDRLFDPSHSDRRLVQVASALIAASASDESLATSMRAWLREFLHRIEDVLSEECPDAPSDTVSAVAAGLTGIHFNVESLYPLGDMQGLSEASRSAALLLVGTLESVRNPD